MGAAARWARSGPVHVDDVVETQGRDGRVRPRGIEGDVCAARSRAVRTSSKSSSWPCTHEIVGRGRFGSVGLARTRTFHDGVKWSQSRPGPRSGSSTVALDPTPNDNSIFVPGIDRSGVHGRTVRDDRRGDVARSVGRASTVPVCGGRSRRSTVCALPDTGRSAGSRNWEGPHGPVARYRAVPVGLRIVR